VLGSWIRDYLTRERNLRQLFNHSQTQSRLVKLSR
jgi:hypothetical protein